VVINPSTATIGSAVIQQVDNRIENSIIGATEHAANSAHFYPSQSEKTIKILAMRTWLLSVERMQK